MMGLIYIGPKTLASFVAAEYASSKGDYDRDFPKLVIGLQTTFPMKNQDSLRD